MVALHGLLFSNQFDYDLTPNIIRLHRSECYIHTGVMIIACILEKSVPVRNRFSDITIIPCSKLLLSSE